MWLLKMFIVLKNYYNENYDFELKIFKLLQIFTKAYKLI